MTGVIHSTITAKRAYTLKTQTTQRYMVDLWTAHDWYMKEDTARKWNKDALHPDGFDPLTMGPTALLEKLRAETYLSLSTAEEIERHIEAFMDANTYPKCTWLSMLVGFFAVLLAVPPLIAAAIAAADVPVGAAAAAARTGGAWFGEAALQREHTAQRLGV